MNKTIAVVAALMAASTVLGEMTEAQLARTGGEIIKRGTFTGKVSVVNQQTRLPVDDCEAMVAIMAEATQCNIALDEGEGATITLFLIDEPEAPIMLIAPEDRWGKLNMARLVEDLSGEKAKAKFFAPRARKMIIKSLSLLMGGGSSQFPGNIMNAATMHDLDYCTETVPMDMVGNYEIYLKSLGVTPKVMTTYKRACKEGWAPEPTNEYQKVIWEKVKAEQSESPSNPIRIKPGDKPKGK